VTIIGAEAQAVQNGVRDDAWDAIVTLDREHGQRLYGYVLRLGVDSGRAGDLVQGALLRLWRELSRGAPITSREAWTYRTLARLAMDEHRLDRRIARLVARLGDGPAPRPMGIPWSSTVQGNYPCDQGEAVVATCGTVNYASERSGPSILSAVRRQTGNSG
jgi:DNA-directed RNA polymerase specialized sigma24 family protein